MKIYSIKDSAAGFWLPPFTARNDDQAVRMFIQSMGEQFRFRSDYALYRFGEWDDDNGELTADEAPSIVMHGSSISAALDPSALAAPAPAATPKEIN